MWEPRRQKWRKCQDTTKQGVALGFVQQKKMKVGTRNSKRPEWS